MQLPCCYRSLLFRIMTNWILFAFIWVSIFFPWSKSEAFLHSSISSAFINDRFCVLIKRGLEDEQNLPPKLEVQFSALQSNIATSHLCLWAFKTSELRCTVSVKYMVIFKSKQCKNPSLDTHIFFFVCICYWGLNLSLCQDSTIWTTPVLLLFSLFFR
jgi:hypothetical protein